MHDFLNSLQIFVEDSEHMVLGTKNVKRKWYKSMLIVKGEIVERGGGRKAS
jgi:hypothetical protein